MADRFSFDLRTNNFLDPASQMKVTIAEPEPETWFDRFVNPLQNIVFSLWDFSTSLVGATLGLLLDYVKSTVNLTLRLEYIASKLFAYVKTALQVSALTLTQLAPLLLVAAVCNFTGIGKNLAAKCLERANAIQERILQISAVGLTGVSLFAGALSLPVTFGKLSVDAALGLLKAVAVPVINFLVAPAQAFVALATLASIYKERFNNFGNKTLHFLGIIDDATLEARLLDVDAVSVQESHNRLARVGGAAVAYGAAATLAPALTTGAVAASVVVAAGQGFGRGMLTGFRRLAEVAEEAEHVIPQLRQGATFEVTVDALLTLEPGAETGAPVTQPQLPAPAPF